MHGTTGATGFAMRGRRGMLLGLWGTTALWCLGCQLADGAPTRVLVPPPEPLVNQQLTDGCTRFALKVVNGVAQVEALYNTNGCQTDQLQLLADSAPTFDVAAGTLRVPIVLKNVGSVAVMAPARIRFNADSSQFLNAQGQVMPGTPNILATNYDTASANGRSGQWRYDTLLAPSGQGQVLAPGATSRRRWLEFAGSDWSQIVRIKVPTMATQVAAIPSVPPDSVPHALINSLPIVSAAGQDSMRSSMLMIRFDPSASVNERQQVLAAVGGTVVGGRRISPTDGFYFIYVPPANTVSSILRLVARAGSYPQVIAAYSWRTQFPDIRAHRRPSDASSGWHAALWNVAAVRADPSSARWALERAALPLAWGCNTDASSINVGVLDVGFHLPLDLSTSVASIVEPAAFQEHGLRVASVIGSRGNNQSGITGVAWTSRLFLRNYRTDPSDSTQTGIPTGANGMDLVEENFVKLGSQVAVLNFSSAIEWLSRSPFRLPNLLDSADIGAITEHRSALRSALQRLSASGYHPMVVLAAGNDSSDASIEGYPQVRSLYPNQVVVVGALSKSGTRANFSNRGALVDLYAPGVDVAVLNQAGSITSESGTSFAAPLVTGVLALMRSAFSSMTNAEAKAALLGGTPDSIDVDGIKRPVLHAYAALRAAAQRAGAPLCGNPLAYVASYDSSAYTTTMSVDVKRGSGSGSTERITQFTIPGLNAVPVYVPHGGREVLVDLLDLQGLRRVAQHNGTSWQTLSQPWQVVNNPDLSGTSWSSRGWSHDGDTALWAGVTYNAGFLTSNASFSLWTNGTQGPAITTFANLPAQWTNPISGIGPYGNGAAAGGVLSPTGDFAIGVVTDGSAVTQYTFYRIAIPSGTRTMLFADNVPQLPQFSPPPWAGTFPLLQLGVAEDGSEFWYTSPAQLVGNSTCIVKRYSLVLGAFTAIDSLPGNGTLLGCTAGTGAAPGGAARVAGMGFSR